MNVPSSSLRAEDNKTEFRRRMSGGRHHDDPKNEFFVHHDQHEKIELGSGLLLKEATQRHRPSLHNKSSKEGSSSSSSPRPHDNKPIKSEVLQVLQRHFQDSSAPPLLVACKSPRAAKRRGSRGGGTTSRAGRPSLASSWTAATTTSRRDLMMQLHRDYPSEKSLDELDSMLHMERMQQRYPILMLKQERLSASGGSLGETSQRRPSAFDLDCNEDVDGIMKGSGGKVEPAAPTTTRRRKSLGKKQGSTRRLSGAGSGGGNTRRIRVHVGTVGSSRRS